MTPTKREIAGHGGACLSGLSLLLIQWTRRACATLAETVLPLGTTLDSRADPTGRRRNYCGFPRIPSLRRLHLGLRSIRPSGTMVGGVVADSSHCGVCGREFSAIRAPTGREARRDNQASTPTNANHLLGTPGWSPAPLVVAGPVEMRANSPMVFRCGRLRRRLRGLWRVRVLGLAAAQAR